MYPESAGFQKHSDTSIEAAKKVDAATLRLEVSMRISEAGRLGCTADEISEQLDTPQSTIAARMRELELKRQVIKTKQKRKTRYNRNAYVYVTPAYFSPDMGRARVKDETPCDILKLQADNKRMREALKFIANYSENNSQEISGDEAVACALGALGYDV